MSEADRLNVGLVRLHRAFFWLYLSVAILMTVFGLRALGRSEGDAAALIYLDLLFLAIAAARGSAAKGARLAKAYGRTISLVIGCCWYWDSPIGTALAVFVFWRTRKRLWKAAPSSPTVSW